MQDTIPPPRDPVVEDRNLQVDPELSMSGGRATPGQIVTTGLAIVAILGVFIYGLNHQRNETAETAANSATTTAAAQPAAPPAHRQSGQNAQAQRGEAQAPGQAPASPSAASNAPPPSSNPSKPTPAQAQSGNAPSPKASQASGNQQGASQPSAGTVSGRGDSATDNTGASPAKSRNGTPPAQPTAPPK
jgi:hypothetical protein